MPYNKEMLLHDLEAISRNTFKDAIELCYRDGVTSKAPLGFSGDTVVIFGKEEGGRISLVSVRNHSGSAELLITDVDGNFLFLGKYLKRFGTEFIANQYWLIFKLVKSEILK